MREHRHHSQPQGLQRTTAATQRTNSHGSICGGRRGSGGVQSIKRTAVCRQGPRDGGIDGNGARRASAALHALRTRMPTMPL